MFLKIVEEQLIKQSFSFVLDVYQRLHSCLDLVSVLLSCIRHGCLAHLGMKYSFF